jgi:hypothetical protein
MSCFTFVKKHTNSALGLTRVIVCTIFPITLQIRLSPKSSGDDAEMVENHKIADCVRENEND